MNLDQELKDTLTAGLADARAALNRVQTMVDAATVTRPPAPDPDPPPPPSPDEPPAPPERPYSPDAPWNQPVPVDAEQDPQGPALVRAVAARAQDSQVHLVQYTARNIGDARTYQAVIGGAARQFRGPAVLRRGDPPDYGMVVIDPVALTAARFYQPSTPSTAGVIAATGAGLFDISERNRTGRPITGGGTGWGLSSDVGVLTVGDVERGRAHHALRLHLNINLFSGRVRAPATKTDPTPAGGWVGPVDYATRFRLDPTLDYRDHQPAAWPEGWKRLHRVIFQALQEYGALVTDRTGTGVVVCIEQDPAGWNRLVGPPDAGTGNYNPVLRGGRVPWTRMQVIAPT